MIVTARNMGKSYGAKIDIVLRSWFKDKRKTLWLRRYGTQVDIELAGDFWGTALETYAEKYGLEVIPEITQDGNVFYMDGEPFCEVMALTEAVNAKGQERVGTANIVLDEFIEKNSWNYVSRDEPTEHLLKMAKTFFRDANIPVEQRHIYLLANAESLVNPYFVEFDVVNAIDEDTEWLIGDNVLVYLPRMSLELKEEMMKDPMNQVIANTSYAAVALENSFFDGGTVNIVKKLLPGSKQMFSIQILGITIFFYRQKDEDGEYFYATTKGTLSKFQYVLDVKSIKSPKEKVIRRDILNELRRVMGENLMKFDSVKTRSIITDTIKSTYM